MKTIAWVVFPGICTTAWINSGKSALQLRKLMAGDGDVLSPQCLDNIKK